MGFALFLLAVAIAAILLFAMVFFIIMFSDLECDFINPIDLCNKLNKFVIPEMLLHAFLSALFLLGMQFIAFAWNIPLLLYHGWLVKEKRHVFDATEIYRTLPTHKMSCFFKLGFYMLSFFFYLYGMILALLENQSGGEVEYLDISFDFSLLITIYRYLHVMIEVVLCKGKFKTTIAGVEVLVNFTIRNNYRIIAKFNSYGVDYEFIMKKWEKTKDGIFHAVSSFNKFAHLALDKFYPEIEEFGSVTIENDIKNIHMSNDQLLNLLQYAMRDVFICAEEIIKTHRRSLLDYCVYHRERGNIDTYEKYIHVISCHCLVQSNFLAPTVSFNVISFVEEDQRSFDREWKSSFAPREQQVSDDQDDDNEE